MKKKKKNSSCLPLNLSQFRSTKNAEKHLCISLFTSMKTASHSPPSSLLVFYIGSILVDKNTLCNGYFLTGLSVIFRVFK